MKIAGLLLAAGASQRLGQPKQLLQIDGEPLIQRAARALLDGGCAPVRVVLGAAAESCRSALSEFAVQITFNERYHQGMGTSIAVGIEALQQEKTPPEAVVVALCDQPFLDADLIAALIRQHEITNCSIIAADYGEALGPPAFFTAAHFHSLAQLNGDQGASSLFRAHADDTAHIPFPQGRTDIDTAADWRALIAAQSTSNADALC